MLTEHLNEIGFRAFTRASGPEMFPSKKNDSRTGCGSRGRRITPEFEASLVYTQSQDYLVLSQNNKRNKKALSGRKSET